MRSFEIFVPGNEVLGWRFCGHQIEERSITLIAQQGASGAGGHKLCFGSDRGQKSREIDTRSGEGLLEFRAMYNGVEFGEGDRTHDRDEASLQNSLNNSCRRPYGGQQAGHENIRVKYDAHGCAAPLRPQRRSGLV